MSSASLAVAAALLYFAASGIQLLHLRQKRPSVSRSVVGAGIVALLCHAVVVWDTVFTHPGLSLGVYKVPALIFLIMNVACFTALVSRPLQNLLIALFPLSGLALLVASCSPDTGSSETAMSGGLYVHIGSSLLAYAVLTLAAAQAAIVAVQDYQLRHHRTRGIVSMLPPLQSMESALFELLWVGVIMLTLAIASGMVYMNDMFAQHLVHKTVLTIVAWFLFSTLLWGHYQLGWRSQTAVRFTLGGFALLMLAFFGSKMVLELVLQRG